MTTSRTKGPGYFVGPQDELSDTELFFEMDAAGPDHVSIFVREDKPFTLDGATRRREAHVVVNRHDYEAMVQMIGNAFLVHDGIVGEPK